MKYEKCSKNKEHFLFSRLYFFKFFFICFIGKIKDFFRVLVKRFSKISFFLVFNLVSHYLLNFLYKILAIIKSFF